MSKRDDDVSDRRRPPKQDDWDDDLDLAGWEQPPARRRPAQQPAQGQNQPRSDRYAIDDAPVEPYDPYQSPPVRRTQPPRDQHSTDPSRSGQGSVRRQTPAQPYRAPAPSSRSAPSSQYGYEDHPEQPTGQSAAAPPQARQRYPAAPADFEVEGYVAPAGRRRRTRAHDPARPRPSVSIPRPAINDGPVIAIVAASLLSLVFMAATIAAGASDLPEWFPIHLNASGDPDSWGASDVLWRIPFGILMAMLMSLVIAAFIWQRDRFAARTAIAGAAVVQVLAWVALVDFVW